MDGTATAPTERELDALKILWARGKATVRDVWAELERRDPGLAYTSVLSLLQSMERKALVSHESAGRAYAYAAKVDRAATLRATAGGFLARVFDGAADEFLAHALDASATPDTLDRLAALVAAAKAARAAGETDASKEAKS